MRAGIRHGDGTVTAAIGQHASDDQSPLLAHELRRTSGNKLDCDGDGVEDGDEVDCGSDPLDPNSKCTGTGPGELPNTGVGANESGSSWLAPLAAAGAGAAFLARKFRGSKTN